MSIAHMEVGASSTRTEVDCHCQIPGDGTIRTAKLERADGTARGDGRGGLDWWRATPWLGLLLG